MVRITILILVVIFWITESNEIANNLRPLITVYETNLNSSIRLEKNDEELRNSWAVEFQVKRINITTKYRLEIIKHREHSFQRPELNEKWSECLYLHKRQIRKGTKDYYMNESECLTTNTLGDADNTRAVVQVEKEIRKWRKGYKYLVNRCNTDNPDDKEAFGVCLVEYMDKDSYNQVIERLIVLKLEAMGQLYLNMRTSLADLEECLKNQLSTYLDNVRTTMETLNKCYTLKTGNN